MLYTPAVWIEIRDYQARAIEELRDCIRRGFKRLILQAATGAGKTVMAAEIIRSAVCKGKRVLFLAHARELVNQCSAKLWDFGVPHGVIMAGEEPTPASVQVASKDTLLARAVRSTKLRLPEADIIFVDEGHRSLSKWWRHLLELYPNAVIIALTATPARGDGRGLGEFYQAMVQTVPVSRLIGDGFLVPTRVFAPYIPNLKGVRTNKKGDYVQGQLQVRMDKVRLVGDIVGHWKELGEDRQTVVFASGVQHSLHIMEEFQKAGISCEHLDSHTDIPERDAILARLKDGTTKIVTNVGVLTEGWDCPAVSCCVLARPTKSFVLFLQMVGRILRPWPGKSDALILDHAGAVYMHGFPDDDVEWTLEPARKIEDAVKERRKEGKRKEPIVCPKCHAVFSGRPECPSCGYKLARKAKPQPTNQGKLVELDRTDAGGGAENEQEMRTRFWHTCLRVMAYKGRTAGAAACMYKDRFGNPPWQDRLPNCPEGEDWKRPVAELYPQYVRRRA